MGGAVGAEYRLQPEVNKGLQAREALFPLEKGGMGTGLKPLNHFRLKAVLRPGLLVGILTITWRSWRLGGSSPLCGSPVMPRSGVTGTARPTLLLLYRELVPGQRAGWFGTGGGQETRGSG